MNFYTRSKEMFSLIAKPNIARSCHRHMLFDISHWPWGMNPLG
jgi:hypothetical protein